MKQLRLFFSNHSLSLFILTCITLGFFYKSILHGLIPFPGDMLVADYEPYRSYSYDGYAPGAVPNKSLGRDVIQEMYPKRSLTISELKSGHIPFWNPYNFAGNPQMANFQSGVFYPLNALYFLFSFPVAWTIFTILAPLMASWFMYLYLQEMHLSKVPSIIGALSFSYSAYMIVWMEYGNISQTFLWLPLVLYFTEKLMKKATVPTFLGAITSLVFAFLAGYIQGYFYLIGIVLVYILIRSIQQKVSLRFIVILASLLLILPHLLTLYQLLPTLRLFGLSTRLPYTLDQYTLLLNPLSYMITILVPDFFGNPATKNVWFYGTYIERVSYFGVVPFFFAIVSLSFLKKRPEIGIFVGLFLTSFVYATDTGISRYFKFIPLSVISTTVPTRALCITAFAGSILGAYGIDYFLKDKHKKALIIAAGTTIGILVVPWISIFMAKYNLFFPGIRDNALVATHNLLLPTVLVILTIVLVLGSTYVKRVGNYVPISVISILCLAELFIFFQKNMPFSPRSYIFPRTPVTNYIRAHQGLYRTWGYGSGYIESNLETYERIYSPNGIDALHAQSYATFLATTKTGKLDADISRSNDDLAPGYGQDDLRTNLYRQRAMDILGIKYVLQKDDSLGKDIRPDETTFTPDRYRLDWQQGSWQIYENKEVLPRAFITDSYEVIPRRDALFTRFYTPEFSPRNDLLLMKDPHLRKNTEKLQAAAMVISYEPTSVTIRASSNKNALLFLSDAYYQGWEATVSGKKARIYQTDYAFRSVAIPGGVSTVVFTYSAPAFHSGRMISLIVFIGILLLSFLLRKKVFYVQKNP